MFGRDDFLGSLWGGGVSAYGFLSSQNGATLLASLVAIFTLIYLALGICWRLRRDIRARISME